MKNRKIVLMLSLLSIFFVTGCTKILKTEEKKVVQNPITGQNLVENILCQPSDEETIKLYLENKVNINSLPRCSEFNVTSGGYEGIWNTIFVKPLAWVIIKVGELFHNYGLSIIFVTLFIRLVLYPITKKTALQSEMLKKAQPELEKLEKKYHNQTSQEAQMQKSQEMLLIYKKYKINPLSGCLFSFIQIPLFFAFYEALNRLPVIFEKNFLTLQLGTTPLTALGNGQYQYLIVVVLAIFATHYSFKLNKTASMGADQEKQMSYMMKFATIMIAVTSFTVSVGIILYWICNNLFTILQNLIVKRGKKNDHIL